MNEKDPEVELDGIRQAATDALTFIEGLDKEAFLKDKRTQKPVAMSLIIIGEAAAKPMDRHTVFTTENSHISLRPLHGMRNQIAHGYSEIDFEVVWDTVETALPTLLPQLQHLGDTPPGP